MTPWTERDKNLRVYFAKLSASGATLGRQNLKQTVRHVIQSLGQTPQPQQFVRGVATQTPAVDTIFVVKKISVSVKISVSKTIFELFQRGQLSFKITNNFVHAIPHP